MGAITHNGEVLQRLPANASQINFDKTGTNLNSTQTESAIKEVNTKANTLQSKKADTDMVAADFDATASYTAGDYCIYEGKFYKFKASHSGAWSASDVDEVKITGELSSLKSGLTDLSEIVGAVASMTDLYPQITYNYNLLAKIGNVIILAVNLNNVNHGAKIGTVPSGYRPSASTGYLPLGISKDANDVYRYSTILVYPDGGVYAYNDSSDAMQTFIGIFMWTV